MKRLSERLEKEIKLITEKRKRMKSFLNIKFRDVAYIYFWQEKKLNYDNFCKYHIFF